MSGTALAKLLLVASMLAGALIYPILGSRRVAAPLDEHRGGPAVRVFVQASVENARTAADPGNAGPASPALSGARFRFGYLEFEDDPDARAK
jgi:hypothetical protein